MPSWIPGEDHLINFQKGEPYVKVDEGYARLPGAGYAALHPELEGVDPENYPAINKLAILGDVAPYSREYNHIRASIEKSSRGDNELRARYEQIVEQVRLTKESKFWQKRVGPMARRVLKISIPPWPSWPNGATLNPSPTQHAFPL